MPNDQFVDLSKMVTFPTTLDDSSASFETAADILINYSALPQGISLQLIRMIMEKIYIRLRFILTGDCGGGCCFDKAFGCFVPEADCVIHDFSPFVN